MLLRKVANVSAKQSMPPARMSHMKVLELSGLGEALVFSLNGSRRYCSYEVLGGWLLCVSNGAQS